MKLSVLILAYNHEKFITQALDSVLMQQVDFDYEIVIGEDCSKDNTRDILIGYQQEHPEKIRLLLPEKNLGMHDNFIQTFKACRGKYIALLEGDDYWTSPYKLQKQVDFLDTHTDYTICFHNALYLYQDGSTRCFLPPDNWKNTFTLEDILSSNIMSFASIVFRQGFIQEFPDWMYDINFVDWILQILLAQHGNIGYINETMNVYRIHPNGNWSWRTQIEMRLEILKAYHYIENYLDSKYQNKIRIVMSENYKLLCIDYMQNNDRENARKFLNKFLLQDFLNNLMLSDLSLKTSFLMNIYLPALYKILKKVKYTFISKVVSEKII
ncbi:glycosyltransferase [Nostoc sp. LEGE 12447]|uniref:glycosyltransferase n=1 Tax=Nostoc sp. LEGE 12447 TaxID=1828640 RepID=UPI0018842E93|nr:glycosyltransferase [Nostoc sp. LEGE 12447]MBE8998645.1 glycosyltransferase [Nostoc sp. LEGE 12447]